MVINPGLFQVPQGFSGGLVDGIWRGVLISGGRFFSGIKKAF